jgi:REP element-mobilizing transposase RayT
MSEKIYHITTAIHDSRTSSRMIKFNVRKLREMGTNPYPNIIYFTQEEELLVAQIISKIVKEDNLKFLASNICSDHIHLLLSCDIDHILKIMQKIKAVTSKNISRLRLTREHAPLLQKSSPLSKRKPIWPQKYSAPKEIVTEEQLQNTTKYIQTNRNKHKLKPHNQVLQQIIDDLCL